MGVAKAIQRDERTHSARVRALDELTGAPDHAVVTRAQGIESQITRTSNICIPISIYRPQGRASLRRYGPAPNIITGLSKRDDGCASTARRKAKDGGVSRDAQTKF